MRFRQCRSRAVLQLHENELIGLPMVDTCLPTERHLLQQRIERVGDQSALRFERQWRTGHLPICYGDPTIAAAGVRQSGFECGQIHSNT